MTTPPTPSAPPRKIRVDKGDYYLFVSDPDQIRSFSISWTVEDMKERDFQAWLDHEEAYMRRKIPHGFVLVDSYMSTRRKGLFKKTWRYAHHLTISIEPKELNPEPITITGKRMWQERNSLHIEATANGVRLGQSSNGDGEAMIERMRKIIKIIKCFGVTKQEDIEKYRLYTTPENAKRLEECQIPEFDSLPFLSLNNL